MFASFEYIFLLLPPRLLRLLAIQLRMEQERSMPETHLIKLRSASFLFLCIMRSIFKNLRMRFTNLCKFLLHFLAAAAAAAEIPYCMCS